jgi:hypothetical protein
MALGQVWLLDGNRSLSLGCIVPYSHTTWRYSNLQPIAIDENLYHQITRRTFHDRTRNMYTKSDFYYFWSCRPRFSISKRKMQKKTTGKQRSSNTSCLIFLISSLSSDTTWCLPKIVFAISPSTCPTAFSFCISSLETLIISKETTLNETKYFCKIRYFYQLCDLYISDSTCRVSQRCR